MSADESCGEREQMSADGRERVACLQGTAGAAVCIAGAARCYPCRQGTVASGIAAGALVSRRRRGVPTCCTAVWATHAAAVVGGRWVLGCPTARDRTFCRDAAAHACPCCACYSPALAAGVLCVPAGSRGESACLLLLRAQRTSMRCSASHVRRDSQAQPAGSVSKQPSDPRVLPHWPLKTHRQQLQVRAAAGGSSTCVNAQPGFPQMLPAVRPQMVVFALRAASCLLPEQVCKAPESIAASALNCGRHEPCPCLPHVFGYDVCFCTF